ncbi:MAG: carbonic anhydrase [Aquiluna sp.]
MRPTNASEAWAALVRGNENFVAGTPLHPRQDAELRKSVAAAQQPFAALFGCSDSRLGAEMIFDVGLGDLFVVRNVGQVIARTIVGSLEFAFEVLKVPLILVLGHDSCGAVKASMDAVDGNLEVKGEFIENLVSRISQTVITSRSNGVADIDQISRNHISDTIDELLEMSSLIREGVESGKLAVVGAQYRLAEGRVELTTSRGQLES